MIEVKILLCEVGDQQKLTDEGSFMIKMYYERQLSRGGVVEL